MVLFGSGLAAAEDEAAVEQLTRMEHQFAEAALERDISSLEKLLAPDFVGVDPRGTELTRAQVLANLQSPDRQITSLRHENVRVRLFGDTAVVLAVTVVRGEYNGQEVAGEFPYMRVWVKRQGEWRAIATQSSAMARQ
jgi:ketosteroid isomerase-like protein